MPVAEGVLCHIWVWDLPGHDFIDPGARDDGTTLRDRLGLIEVLGVDDAVTGDGVLREWQVFGPVMEDFPPAREMTLAVRFVCG